jgi:hypothetical protein
MGATARKTHAFPPPLAATSPVLQWIEDNDIPLCPTYTDVAAARGGHVHIMQWISDHNPFLLDQKAWYEAVRAGQFRAMQWMMEMPERSWRISNSRRERYMCYEAAIQHDNMDMLVCYCGKLPPSPLFLSPLIGEYGRLDMLKFM